MVIADVDKICYWQDLSCTIILCIQELQDHHKQLIDCTTEL